MSKSTMFRSVSYRPCSCTGVMCVASDFGGIAGTEVVAKFITETAADELRGEVVRTIKRAKLPKSNINKGESAALQTLKKDNSIIILPADKGRATVIMNTADYREND